MSTKPTWTLVPRQNSYRKVKRDLVRVSDNSSSVLEVESLLNARKGRRPRLGYDARRNLLAPWRNINCYSAMSLQLTCTVKWVYDVRNCWDDAVNRELKKRVVCSDHNDVYILRAHFVFFKIVRGLVDSGRYWNCGVKTSSTLYHRIIARRYG